MTYVNRRKNVKQIRSAIAVGAASAARLGAGAHC